ncbi:acyl--CoA ligase [Cupriavidus metallidurans]|uniref:Long-chain fatty acid--CoA ligase n=2 Tax=Burkholderiaceae TaxID=119060 RepID=A0A2L0XC60_9BURK|nr:class I adenylate-forming enzyme family protein [Cupriavidus metallidurans]KWR84041.1 fatty acid--CoA ligase [Cupriavidus sp. SHE]AVA37688.1 fatty acid--CoA ligase [Cupriavidus metallidurans]MDE4920010.1 class I adenylate-forming enzyme family protein [Cupriavidus metallidurans]QBP14143.1 long-chain fatty acid--CoA ligase [Cupriavidus metallidurans]QGS33376.1 AMP-binding protein [Cupriavidus metallidurans]
MSLAEAHARLTAPGAPFETETRVIRGIPTTVWKNAPPTLRDLFLIAAAWGDKTFVVYEEERVSYRAFAQAATTLAQQLVRDGIHKGDRVAVAMRNLPEWPVAFYAAILAGAIVTPLNAWWTGPELEYGLADSGSRVAIVDYERLDRITEHLAACPDLERIYVVRAPANATFDDPRIVPLASVIGESDAWPALPSQSLPVVPLDPDDDVTIFYTSGTTGKPKGAVGTHRNACTVAVCAQFSPLRNLLRRGEPVPEPNPDAPQKGGLLAVPFFHVTGCMSILNGTLATGGKIVLLYRWDTLRAMELIQAERCTGAGGVPTIAWQILEHPQRGEFDLSSLENMNYGGAPASPELVRRIKEVFPHAAPGIGWGMTETSATFTSHSAEEYIHRPDSAGPALPICEMKIDDGFGRALPPGEVGELLVRGANVVHSYWNKPEATAKTFVDGWLHTGDVARIDEDGFLYIVDRMKDMLIRGGENIYCIEVESTLYDHPAIMDAAVVGIPHRTLGEEPGAVVSLKPGMKATEAELQEFVRARLAAFKVPVRVIVLEEMLPRNPNGKILKSNLRKLFAA